MSAWIKKLSKIGIIVTLMMFCVGIASAANGSLELGLAKERVDGYITLEKLTNNPKRYFALPTEDGYFYLDGRSIKVKRDDIWYRTLEVRFFAVDLDKLPGILLYKVKADFNMVEEKPITINIQYTQDYDLDGKFNNSHRLGSDTQKVKEFSPMYLLLNMAYIIAFGEIYSTGFDDIFGDAYEKAGILK